MSKKIALTILLLLNRKDLLSRNNQNNNENNIFDFVKNNKEDNQNKKHNQNEILDSTQINNNDDGLNKEEKDSSAFLEALSKEFTPEELATIKEMPLHERLKKIPNSKEANVLRAIESMKEVRYIVVDLKHNVHPVKIITKPQLDSLEMNNFRENTSSVKAEKQIKELSKQWIKRTKNILSEIIEINNKEIDINGIKNPLLKKSFLEEKEKLDNAFALFNGFEKMHQIGEKEWFDLFALKDIGLELVEKDIVDSIPSIKNNKRIKKLLSLTDIPKIIKNNVFQGSSITFSGSLKDNDCFDYLEKIYNLALEFLHYDNYVKQKQISIKGLLKYLKEVESRENQEQNNIKHFSLDNEVAKSVLKLKFSGHNSKDLEKSLLLWLTNNNKATKEQLNKLDDVGTINYNSIVSSLDKNDSNIPFKYFLDVISLYLYESGDNSIESKDFIKFKNENNKNTNLSVFKNIDEMIRYIDQSIYNPRFITVSKKEIGVNSKYLDALRMKIVQWEEIKNKLFEMNSKKEFSHYIDFVKLGVENIKDRYLLQALFNNNNSSLLLGEYIRNFAGQFIKKELPASSEVIINPKVEKVLFTDLEILPRNFQQFNREGSSMEARKEITGINGNPGSGKSLLAKNFIINFNLARVFGKVPSAKMQISPDIDLKKTSVALIRNQGEIPGELSNHQTNSLVFLRLMEYLESRQDHAIIFCDEILSGTNPSSAERMINKNPAIKDLLYTGKLSLWSIEHNEETRNNITTRDLCLNFDLRDIRNAKNQNIINALSYKKEYLFEADHPELFSAFLDKKFFGRSNPDQSNITLYFEIDKNSDTLKTINKEEYDKIIKRTPHNAVLYTYTPLLNNLQNHHDRSGNVTYDDREKKLIFNQPTMLFTSNNKKYMAILNIKPEYKDGEIIYNVTSDLKFYDINFLIKKNSNIITIDKHQDQSYENMEAHLLLSKDSNLQDVTNEKIEEEHSKRINMYLEKKAREAEIKYANLE